MSPERSIVQERESEAASATFKKEAYTILRPSPQLAWMLGVLSGAGSVKDNRGKITLKSVSKPELLTEFATVGQALFQKEPKMQPNEIKPNAVCFYGCPVAREIGDLRNNAWTETIQNRHRWILDDGIFTWKFIEGLFDSKATLKTDARNLNTLVFATTNFANADFIKKLLLAVGVRKPTMNPQEQPKGTLYVVSVYNIVDLKLIADNIHSTSPEKQAKLKDIKKAHFPATAMDLQLELERLGNPDYYEFVKLYLEGKTKFSREPYERIFGGGSFRKTRKLLEKIKSKGIRPRTMDFRSQIGEDERQIWKYAVEYGLIEKMIVAGMITPEQADSMEIYCVTGLVPKDFDSKIFVEKLDILSVAVANLAL